MTRQEEFELLRKLYNLLEDPEWDDSGFSGNLLKSDIVLQLLEDLETRLALKIRKQNGLSVTLQQLKANNFEGEALQIEVEPPRGETYIFAQTLDDLLSSFDFGHKLPSIFYIADEDYLSNNTNVPLSVSKYIEAVSLIEILEQVCDYVGRLGKDRLLVFLGAKLKKLEVPVLYSNFDLISLEIPDDLKEDLTSAPHKEVKRTLFKSVLVENLEKTSRDTRFSALLQTVIQLWRKYKDNYHLYISEFSFETELEKLQSQKREYLLKLNSILGDIENKLLAIPISLVLVGGQMRLGDPTKSGDVTNALIGNAIILVAAIVFATLMLILSSSQEHSLGTIKRDYNSRKERWEVELPNAYDEFNEAFQEIDARYSRVKNLILYVKILVWLGLVFSIGLFLFFSTPFSAYVLTFWKSLHNFSAYIILSFLGFLIL